MLAKTLLEKLDSLENSRQICVVGAAIIDIVSNVAQLPSKGSDIELMDQDIHLGGCAYNIAITLQRLGLKSTNALPVGKGKWAELTKSELAKQGLKTDLPELDGDNGWCLALVEPDGERTFLSASGIENQWSKPLLSRITLDNDAIVYISGYQLSSDKGGALVDWLETLPGTADVLIDFGPRVSQLEPPLMERLLNLRPIISLNRQEALELEVLDENDMDIKSGWHEMFGGKMVIRLDSEGAIFSDNNRVGRIPPFATKVIDTIGAGDCHAGGMLAGLASNWSLEDSVILGNAIASFVVSHRGGDSAPTKSELIGYLQPYI